MPRAAVHSLAALVLAVASVAIWHWRFEVDPGALPEVRLDDALVGWSSPDHRQHELEKRDDGLVLVLERKGAKEKAPGVHVLFTRLERVNYVHIRCEARWQGVKVGPRDYMIARFVSMKRDASGRMSHPEGGFQVFGGVGDSGWKHYEVVQRLSSDMHAYGLAIEMLGESGRLEVRDLGVTAVRQRGWVPPATAVVLLGWTGLLASLIRMHSHRPAWTRTTAGALMMVTCGWVLVFPQMKRFRQPVLGHFEVGDAARSPVVQESSPAVASPPARPDRPGRADPAPPAPVPPKDESAGEDPPPRDKAVSRETPEETRDSGWLYRFLYRVDQRFVAAHLVLFAGVTWLFLAITGSASQWRLPLALAILAEVVPELIDHLGGWDDWFDLASNLAGVGLAVLVWCRVPMPGWLRGRSSD